VINTDEIEMKAKKAEIKAKEKTAIDSDKIETKAKTTEVKTSKLDVV
jgi:hypothetical protein